MQKFNTDQRNTRRCCDGAPNPVVMMKSIPVRPHQVHCCLGPPRVSTLPPVLLQPTRLPVLGEKTLKIPSRPVTAPRSFDIEIERGWVSDKKQYTGILMVLLPTALVLKHIEFTATGFSNRLTVALAVISNACIVCSS